MTPSAASPRDPRVSRGSLLRYTPTWIGGLAVGGTAVLAYTVFQLIDARALGSDRHPWQSLTKFDLETVQNALGNLAQIVAAILAISITVVAIVVQLAALRYTPRLTNLFFRDRTNMMVLGFLVSSCLYTMWISLSVSSEHLPHRGISFAVFLVSADILTLIPYFSYVFRFLEPEHVVARLRLDCLHTLTKADRAAARDARQRQFLADVERLADIGGSAIHQNDRSLATNSVEAVADLAIEYVRAKPDDPEWFRLSEPMCANPDFLSQDEFSLRRIERDRVWVEFKLLRQLQSIFGIALAELRDIAVVVAIQLRRVGEAALGVGADAVLGIVLEFFNTLLRAAINAKDVRTTFNVLHQYRQLGEAMIRAGRSDQGVECAERLRYYGLQAHGLSLPFIVETAAYDVAALCELASELDLPADAQILDILLQVDKEPDTPTQEASLRGVRKAQVKLATYYLARGREDKARRIHRDMIQERPERLKAVREDLLGTEDEAYWEVVERGANFDYLEPERRAQLDRFFGWFPGHAIDHGRAAE